MDTRALTIKIREHGAIRGMIADINISDEEVLAKLKETPVLNRHVEHVSTKMVYTAPGSGTSCCFS